MKKLYMIGNTHFDPVWLWRWDEAMASIRASFRSALDRMREDADFIYSFATPPVFEWIRKVDPEMFREIRERVREGRWELCEAWWVQPDCYGASGESYVRQGLYGQRYLLEHFGRISDTVFNIDSFGHSPMLPQILKKSGVRYYCFVRPEVRHVKLDSPLFRWESADGSRVLAYRADGVYKYDVRENFEDFDGKEDALIVYGVTDHGGAPTKKAISDIHGEPRAIFSTVSGFFENRDTEYTVTDELLTGDCGPYANYSRIKKLNRLAEYAALSAERAALIAGRDKRGAIAAIWHDILFNQFHDILGGACIKDAYIDAEAQLFRAIATANEIMHLSLQSVTRRIAMPGKNPETVWNIVLWNLNGSAFSGYCEAEVQWAHEFPWYDRGIALADAEGRTYPCQVIRERSVIPRFRSRFIFKADVPSVGYRAFRLIKTDEPVTRRDTDPYRIRTKRLDITFSKEDGAILSVCDSASGERLSGRTLVPAVYPDKGDTWCFNTDGYEPKEENFAFEGASVIEAGELMTEIRARYRLAHSLLDIYYRFFEDEKYFDVRYRVNFEDSHKVIKLECETDSDVHLAAVPAGVVTRGGRSSDVPLGAFVSVGNMTLASDSVFAYRMEGGRLGLTLLRSPIYGDLRISEIDETLDYDIIDRGIVEGRIRLGFGLDGWETADALVNPPTVIDEACHGGELSPEGSFFSVDARGISLMALKESESGDGVTLRLAECLGEARTVHFSLHGCRHSAELSPYEIKTLSIKESVCTEISMLELSADEMNTI